MSGMSPDRPGFELPLLLGSAFRVLIDELHVELSRRGHADARPLHGFALQAIGPTGVSIGELGRRLGVSKQAAAKTASALERLGYAQRRADPDDRRATLMTPTSRGSELLDASAEIFDVLRAQWIATLGREPMREMENALEAMLPQSGKPRLADLPGWLRQGT